MSIVTLLEHCLVPEGPNVYSYGHPATALQRSAMYPCSSYIRLRWSRNKSLEWL